MSQSLGSLAVLSINHETVPLEVRERYALDKGKVEHLYATLRRSGKVDETLVLNTCNRFELYAQLSPEAGLDDLSQLLSQFYGKPENEVMEHLKAREGQAAIQHLIEVAAGLRSQLIGEAEILGQVKNAYAASHEGGHAGKVINRVFQKAFQAAKFIRHTTSVGEGTINIAHVAVDLSAKIFGDLSAASVLALGTGEIGEKTVKALRHRGARAFGIASRTEQRAAAVANEWGGTPHALDRLQDYLAHYDIVIASTTGEQPVVTLDLIKSCSRQREDRPLFLIDLGLPRNIEDRCGNFDNVFLYNLDDLAGIAEENMAERKKALRAAHEIAAQKSEYIWDSIRKRGLA